MGNIMPRHNPYKASDCVIMKKIRVVGTCITHELVDFTHRLHLGKEQEEQS